MMKSQAQTGHIFRFTLKKEWLKLLLWLTGCAFYVIMGVVAFVEVYGDPLERQSMAVAMQNPAMEALFGRAIGIDNYTIGAMYSHTMTILGFVLFAVMSILLVVRNTRSEEEDGILEMIQALPTGRLAHTTSAILLLLLTNGLLAIISTVLLIVLGDGSMGTEGAILTGIVYGMSGIVFGSVTLVTAQLSSNARGAMMMAFGVLGASYMLRIVGDSGIELLSWLSPLGLLYGSEPFVNNYWFPVWISIGLSLLLITIALWLKHQRDMGAGLLPDRAGKRHATALLKTPMGFVLKLVKTPLVVWAIAMLLLGVSYGSVIGDVEGLLEGNEVIEQIIAADPDLSMVDQFMAMILGVLAMAATIPSIQVLLRLRGEEKKNRLEKIIAGSHSRLVIFGSFIVVSVVVVVLFQLLQSFAFGGSAVFMDYDVLLREIIVAAMAYIPAILVMIGVASVLIGWLPKLTSLIWLYVGFAFVVLYFGGLFDMPDFINGLSPFYHVPEMPIEEWSWTVTTVLSLLSLVLMAVGYAGFRRRDID
ncbi:ABC transporter permease [Alkalibacterium olivapovliticus]|nr:ABC transporter permease [Alkalibacterium olivapovliticus]